jgi:hypothetical protein
MAGRRGCGRMTSTPLEPESRWEAELQRRGAAAVAAALASEGVGIGRGAVFRLFVHALANPPITNSCRRVHLVSRPITAPTAVRPQVFTRKRYSAPPALAAGAQENDPDTVEGASTAAWMQ